jgi:hypothetical protein
MIGVTVRDKYHGKINVFFATYKTSIATPPMRRTSGADRCRIKRDFHIATKIAAKRTSFKKPSPPRL